MTYFIFSLDDRFKAELIGEAANYSEAAASTRILRTQQKSGDRAGYTIVFAESIKEAEKRLSLAKAAIA